MAPLHDRIVAPVNVDRIVVGNVEVSVDRDVADRRLVASHDVEAAMRSCSCLFFLCLLSCDPFCWTLFCWNIGLMKCLLLLFVVMKLI